MKRSTSVSGRAMWVGVSAVAMAMTQGCLTPESATTEVPPAAPPPERIVRIGEPVLPPPIPVIPAIQEDRVPVRPPDAPPPPRRTYTVQKGDILSIIASRYGVTVADLAEENGIKKANRIFVGQKLALPPHALQKPKPIAPRKKYVLDADGGYVVQRGDTLSLIAQKFGTTSAAIREANNLSGDTVRFGKRLVIRAKVTERELAPPEPETVPPAPAPEPVAPPADASKALPMPPD